MLQPPDGSTKRLIQLCFGYFVAYVITGITVKYFAMLGMSEVEFLVYSTLGGSAICLVVVFARGWYRSEGESFTQWGPLRFPSAYLYIIPSGVFTAVVIPTTTMMYMLPISVMVAMVIMRASVIVISRVVDGIQISQGILDKKVYWEENAGVVFAICAVGTQLALAGPKDFDFVNSPIAVTILGSYIFAYAFRIYIMNYYKNTRSHKTKLNNTWFFSVEQIAATVAMTAIGLAVFFSPELLGVNLPAAAATPVELFRGSFTAPKELAPSAILAGTAYGMVAFFSVFIFMFKGRTATFAGLVNRLTSLVAGTTSTLIVAVAFNGKFPKMQDWISLGFILIAVWFLTRSEKRRVSELKASHEISTEPEEVKLTKAG